MLIDQLNVRGEANQLFPFDINFPLVAFEKFGFLYIGSLVDFGDGYWIMSPCIYSETAEDGYYTPCANSFRLKSGEVVQRAISSDEIRLAYVNAEFNIGLISGIPFSFTTRIH